MYTYKGVKEGSNVKRISNTYTYKGNQTYTYMGLKGHTPKGQRLGCLVNRYAGRISKTYT